MLDFKNLFEKYPLIYILPALGGVSLTFSFAPFGLSFLAWFSFIPFFYSLQDGKRPFLKGYIMGIAFFSTLLYWVSFSDVENAIVPQVVLGSFLLIIYLSIFFGLSGVLYNRFNRPGWIFLFPIVFAGLEFLRSLSSVWSFPWGSIGFSQSNLIHLIQFASIGGVPLVSAWVLFLNIFLYLFFKRLREKRKEKFIYLYSFFSFIIIPFVYSEVVIRKGVSAEYKTIGVIQPNVPTKDKRTNDFERLLKIKTVVEDCPAADLYVLPETASPIPLSHDIKTENFFKDIAKEKNSSIITGMLDYQREEEKVVYFNAAGIVDSSGIIGIYRKIYLLPFVERLPFDDIIPALKKVNLGQGHYTAGSEFSVFETGNLKFSVYICYEAIFSQLIREFVTSGAEILINITEDGWFGRTNGPFQHAQMAAFQSIVFRRAVVRSANTGISFISDPYGKIVYKTRLYETACIVDRVPLIREKTVYTKIGNTFGWVFFCFVLLLFAVEPLKNKKSNIKMENDKSKFKNEIKK
jgi:apolipoprotein N-acyltransferase